MCKKPIIYKKKSNMNKVQSFVFPLLRVRELFKYVDFFFNRLVRVDAMILVDSGCIYLYLVVLVFWSVVVTYTIVNNIIIMFKFYLFENKFLLNSCVLFCVFSGEDIYSRKYL